jgi:signal peptidase II
MSREHVAVFVFVLVACVGCDQAAKTVAQSSLAGSPAISLLGDTVRFELTTNTGAFLSLGAGLSEAVRQFVFQGVVPFTILALCVLAWRSGASALALGLIAGGGLGNWIDRIVNAGAVTDFVSLGAGPLRTGIFNLADVFIVLGVLLTVFGMENTRERRAKSALPVGHGPE